jgi:hypothetical protein
MSLSKKTYLQLLQEKTEKENSRKMDSTTFKELLDAGEIGLILADGGTNLTKEQLKIVKQKADEMSADLLMQRQMKQATQPGYEESIMAPLKSKILSNLFSGKKSESETGQKTLSQTQPVQRNVGPNKPKPSQKLKDKVSSSFGFNTIQKEDISPTLSTPSSVLTDILKIMVKADEEKKLEYDKEKNFFEQKQKKSEKRHEELIKALTGRVGVAEKLKEKIKLKYTFNKIIKSVTILPFLSTILKKIPPIRQPAPSVSIPKPPTPARPAEPVKPPAPPARPAETVKPSPSEVARKKAEEKLKKDAEEKLRKDAEEKLKKDAEEKLRKDAEEKLRKDAEEKLKKDAEEKLRKDAEEKLRKDAEEKLRKEAAEKLKKDAEEKLKKDAEEKLKKDAEEKLRKDAEEKLRKDAEEKLRKDAEEKLRKDAEEKLRKEAAEKLRKDAEEKLRKDAEEKLRKDAEEKLRKEAAEKLVKEQLERERRSEIKRESRRTSPKSAEPVKPPAPPAPPARPAEPVVKPDQKPAGPTAQKVPKTSQKNIGKVIIGTLAVTVAERIAAVETGGDYNLANIPPGNRTNDHKILKGNRNVANELFKTGEFFEKDLTEMTIEEVLKLGRARSKHYNAAGAGAAMGKYQFMPSTLEEFAKRVFGYGWEKIIYDEAVQEVLMQSLTQANIKALLGYKIPLTDANLYLAHFAGAGGAVPLIKALESNPNATMESVLSQAAITANESIVYEKIYLKDPKTNKFILDDKKRPIIDKVRKKTVQEFINILKRKGFNFQQLDPQEMIKGVEFPQRIPFPQKVSYLNHDTAIDEIESGGFELFAMQRNSDNLNETNTVVSSNGNLELKNREMIYNDRPMLFRVGNFVNLYENDSSLYEKKLSPIVQS